MNLTKSKELNGQHGVVVETYDNEQRMGIAIDKKRVSVACCNLLFPARCAACDSEVTSGSCFACQFSDTRIDKQFQRINA